MESQGSCSSDYDYDDTDEVPFWFSCRFGLAVLGFFGFFSASCQRVCIHFALNSMVQQPSTGSRDWTRSDYVTAANWTAAGSGWREASGNRSENFTSPADAAGCPDTALFRINDPNRTLYYKILPYVVTAGALPWRPFEQQFVLRSYSWGAAFVQLPSGWAAEQFGGKRTFGVSLLAASIATMLIPLAASGTHYLIVLILRFIVGVGAGAAFPAMHALWGKWAPPLERSRLACITYSGAILGNVIAFPLTEILCEFGFGSGWPSVFYMLGGTGVLWFFLWMMFTAETPSQHPLVGKVERQYLYDELCGETTLEPRNGCKLPWLRIIVSPPFLAIVACHFAYEWGLYTLQYSVPEFFKHVLFMDVRNRGAFSVVPYFSMWLLILFAGVWGDRMLYWGLLGIGGTRKVLQTAGTLIPAALLVGLSFLDCRQWRGAVALVMVAISCSGFQFNGFLVSHLDIAPQYAGFLFGLGNTVGAAAPLAASIVVDHIRPDKDDVGDWRLVFYIAASLYAGATVLFLLCGSGDLQSWARPRSESLSRTPSSGDKLSEAKADGRPSFELTCTHVTLPDKPLPGDDDASRYSEDVSSSYPNSERSTSPVGGLRVPVARGATDSVSDATSSLSSLDTSTLSRYRELSESLV